MTLIGRVRGTGIYVQCSWIKTTASCFLAGIGRMVVSGRVPWQYLSEIGSYVFLKSKWPYLVIYFLSPCLFDSNTIKVYVSRTCGKICLWQTYLCHGCTYFTSVHTSECRNHLYPWFSSLRTCAILSCLGLIGEPRKL